MLETPKRDFKATPAVRRQVPLWIGLYGPSGGGKTYTALRLASGIQKVQGGPIFGIDTEAGRMLHYAETFEFQHIPFEAPYGSLDYLAAIKYALKEATKTGKRPTVIIDSMSHEHEGPGGMVDLQDQIARKMATRDGEFDARKYERVKMLAWAEPKAKRRALINGMLGLEANFILCFRAKESSVPVQKVEKGANGREYSKTEVVHMGFVPIGGDEFIYECTLAALLPPGARGVPLWESTLPGERKMIKVPEQFKSLYDITGRPLDEAVGGQLAKWADGPDGAKPQPPQQQSAPSPAGQADTRAQQWIDWLAGELAQCTTMGEVNALVQGDDVQRALVKLRAQYSDLAQTADREINQRMIQIDMGEGSTNEGQPETPQ